MAAKRKTVEERMVDFKRQCDELTGEGLQAAVQTALSDPSNLVVEMAARAVVDLEPGEVSEALVVAYRRFLDQPLKTDKQCRAKLPLVEALNSQRYDNPDFYLAGMKYVQMEPAYGAPNGYEDSAGHLRGACAFGLIQIPLASQNDVLFGLVDLLNDDLHIAREAAARALSATGFTAAAPLLRMKVLQGDRYSEVIGACFSGLLQFEDRRLERFVAEFLTGRSLDLAIEAGLALGASRKPEAIDLLIEASRQAVTELRQSLLMSVGLSRLPSAIDHLVSLIAAGGPDAAIAIEALAPARFDERVCEAVQTAVSGTGNRELARIFNETF